VKGLTDLRRAGERRRNTLPDSDGSPGVLALRDVTVQFGGLRALDRVTLEVMAGRVVGIIGPNGAGKTTLFNVIGGFCLPSSGHVAYRGEDVGSWPPHKRGREGLVRTFQNVGLTKGDTVAENLLSAVLCGQPLRTELKALCQWGTSRKRLERNGSLDRIDGVIRLLALEDLLRRSVSELSVGTSKRVELACAIVRKPKVLLLDEPTAGLSEEETRELGTVLIKVHAEQPQMALLIIEHDMELMMRVAEYLYVLNFGAVIAEGAPGEVRKDPLVLEAYLGPSMEEHP
jgi:branched-chain amino acid transport system ATP-binding protein